jgi:hypothetical protein
MASIRRSWRLVPTPRKNVRGVQWLLLDATGRRCTSLFMTPEGKIETRWELGLRYKSQTLWTKKRLAHRRHKVIEKLAGRTDVKWVREHPTYVPDRPKRMRRTTYRRLRKRLTTTPRKQPELNELVRLIGQLSDGWAKKDVNADLISSGQRRELGEIVGFFFS